MNELQLRYTEAETALAAIASLYRQHASSSISITSQHTGVVQETIEMYQKQLYTVLGIENNQSAETAENEDSVLWPLRKLLGRFPYLSSNSTFTVEPLKEFHVDSLLTARMSSPRESTHLVDPQP